MEEFALIFRRSIAAQLSEEEIKEVMPKWEKWVAGIAAQGKFKPGAHLKDSGKVLMPGGQITDGPFVEVKEQLLGVIFVLADDIDEAITLAHGCPILEEGGHVEVRPVRKASNC